MQILPSGLVVPPLPYVITLVVLTAASVAGLYLLDPPVTSRQVLALAPWMIAGGAFHAFEQAGLFPTVLEPFFAAPAVYVTTFLLAAAVWLPSVIRAQMLDDVGRIARNLGVFGTALVLALTGVAYAFAIGRVDSTTALVWLPIGFLGAGVLTAPVYYLLALKWTGAVDRAGVAGPLVVYAHALDGFSTAVGVDVIGTGERTPIPRRIMDFAETLPTYPYIGKGWLFAVVKLVVAAGIVVLLADLVEDDPTQGNLLFAFVAAVGMGPAGNNLFLFLIGPAL
ncbi:DUF63 family protein [Halosimplex litoreum]|uniref:DUF63 family protein n=1 Tax=Halosimplex litoreum TaxID=1198301 RepID=A0A7T3FV51_9EURY|nr:DUF63 family protein [Halosimplex litoreum]QPV61300.1 DUF63 family protein [Halosimplex litoreum]